MAGRNHHRSRVAAFGLALAGLAILLTGVAVSMASPVSYSFAGSPAAPLAAAGVGTSVLPGWDVQVHSRDISTWQSLEPMQAQHGAACDAPPATHLNSSYEGAVFQCKDHVMTAINAGGYGVIYLTPPQMVDFSNGGTVSFDVSTERMSQRDWIDVWVTPYADNLALPFDTGNVDLQGVPRTGIHISNASSQNVLTISTIRNSVETELYRGDSGRPSMNEGIAPGTNQSATRQKFVLTMTRTSLKLERMASATASYLLIEDQAVPDVGFSQGVVQFGQHSYNPTKDNSGVPATWHWDNIAISPSVPFSIQRLTPRFIGDPGGIVVASVAGTLRFSGICKVSIDGVLVAPKTPTLHNEHFNSYAVPVSAGPHTISFGPDGWYKNYPCGAKDFAIWNLSGAAALAPTSTPTKAAAAATATPTTPGATATVTTTAATATPTIVRSTATPTAVPPTATATPVPPTVGAKTVPPTSTPTAIPPTPASPAVASAEIPDGWLAGAVLSNTSLLAGSRLWMTASVTSPIATSALIDVEIYSPSGQKVYQRYYDGRSFNAGDSRTFTSAWLIPRSAPRGTYTVKIGVFKVGWAGLFAWEDQAARFTVR